MTPAGLAHRVVPAEPRAGGAGKHTNHSFQQAEPLGVSCFQSEWVSCCGTVEEVIGGWWWSDRRQRWLPRVLSVNSACNAPGGRLLPCSIPRRRRRRGGGSSGAVTSSCLLWAHSAVQLSRWRRGSSAALPSARPPLVWCGVCVPPPAPRAVERLGFLPQGRRCSGSFELGCAAEESPSQSRRGPRVAGRQRGAAAAAVPLLCLTLQQGGTRGCAAAEPG